MIKLLVPLGLLGLLSILVLILIYIIRPNYQTKYISSTQIWVDSLRYRKKRLNTNTLRNVLLLICQVLILTCISFVISQPILNKSKAKSDEVVAIIDASASMRTEINGVTRYERALNAVIKLTNDTASDGDYMTVILADSSADYLADDSGSSDDASSRFVAKRVEPRNASRIISVLQKLLDDSDACNYGVSDTTGAMRICEDIIAENPKARFYYYTDTEYANVPDEITVKREDVVNAEEWNAAILDAYAFKSDGYYSVVVDAATYGGGAHRMNIVMQTVSNRNMISPISVPVEFEDGVTKRITFYVPSDSGEKIANSGNFVYQEITEKERFTSFDSIEISITAGDSQSADDSLAGDNKFYIYGGTREVVNIEYVSDDPCPFISTGLDIVRTTYRDIWDIRVTEVNSVNGGAVATSGYDFYIFENANGMLSRINLPDDGVVFLIGLTTAPAGAGFSVMYSSGRGRYTASLPKGQSAHSLLNDIDPTDIDITEYYSLTYEEDRYTPVMMCDESPVLLSCNNEDDKILVMAFSIHYSNWPKLPEWSWFLLNIFDYYFPNPLSKNVFEVGENIQLSSRAKKVEITYENDEAGKTVYEQFPQTFSYSQPGTYTIKQESYFGKPLDDLRFYVKSPSSESNIWLQLDSLPEIYLNNDEKDNITSLLVWIAAALLALQFVEWILYWRTTR